MVGEWHEDDRHGISKETHHERSFWGQFKHFEREGFTVSKLPDGTISYYHFKSGKSDECYGIQKWEGKGEVYHGELKHESPHGYGLMKYENNDEYDGQWNQNQRHGEGVFKEAATWRVERRLYRDDKFIKVLEVIDHGI